MFDSIIPTQKCTQCGVEKPATTEHFYKDTRKTDGLRSKCIACTKKNDARWYSENAEKKKESIKSYKIKFPEKQRERQRRWRNNNPNKSREYSRTYYANHQDEVRKSARDRYAANPEKARERSRQYRSAHPNKVREYSRIYYLTHSAQRLQAARRWKIEHSVQHQENQRRWRIQNLERDAAKSRNRRARVRNAEGTHTAADIAAQTERQKNKCYYCGCKMTTTPYLSNSQTVDHVVPLARGGRNSPDNLVIACRNCNLTKFTKLLHEWTENGRLL